MLLAWPRVVFFRDEQLAGDGRYRMALHEQLGHLNLARRKAVLLKVAANAALLLGGAVTGNSCGVCCCRIRGVQCVSPLTRCRWLA